MKISVRDSEWPEPSQIHLDQEKLLQLQLVAIRSFWIRES